MNHDGWGQVGAGQGDIRPAHREPVRKSKSGGPMKEALDAEQSRHNESKSMRLEHLKKHYER